MPLRRSKTTRRPVKRRPLKKRRSTRYKKRSALRPRKVKQECKKKEIEPVSPLPLDGRSEALQGNTTLVPIDTFSAVPAVWTSMTLGVQKDEMTGRDMCLKYLHVKMRITFPAAGLVTSPAYFRVMHGWVKMPGCPTPEDDVKNVTTRFKTDVDVILKREFSKVLEGPDRSVVQLLSDRMITRKGVNADGGGTGMSRMPIDLHFKWAPNRVIRYDTKLYGGGLLDRIPTVTNGLWIPFYVVWQQTNTLMSSSEAGSPSIKWNILSSYQKRETMYFTDS